MVGSRSVRVQTIAGVFALVYLAFPGATVTDSAPSQPTPEVTSGTVGLAPTLLSAVSLSMVLQDDVLGIKQPDYPEEQFEKLRQQAVNYIEFRKKYRKHKRWKPSDQPQELFSQCLESFDQNPYCYYMTQKWLDLATIPRLRHLFERVQANKVTRVNTRKIAHEIRKVQVAELLNYRRFQIQRTLKKFNAWDQLKPLADALLTTSEEPCKTAPIFTALGLKAEEYFPQEEFKNISIALYERASACPLVVLKDSKGVNAEAMADDEPAALARYRRAMIHIWSNKCDAADKDLEALSDQEGGQFVTRGLFWRGWCAKAQGNKSLVQVFKNRLQRVNPMGYHTLLMSKSKITAQNDLAYSRAPEVVFSSKSKPYLDLFVRSAEMLHLLGHDPLAVEILDHIDEQLDQTEPGYRLYVAALAQKLSAKFLQFRILARLFPDEPAMLSSEVLKMFFPLENFEVIKQHEKTVDPYLTAALIRQESGFNTHARSRAGALGLMQLMPATARRLSIGVSRSQLYKPDVNVKLGTKYFQNLVKKFNGDVELALAAYNAGPNNVNDWLERYPTDNRLLFLDLIPFSETRNYVVLIRRNQFWYLNLYSPESLASFSERYREIASQFE